MNETEKKFSDNLEKLSDAIEDFIAANEEITEAEGIEGEEAAAEETEEEMAEEA